MRPLLWIVPFVVSGCVSAPHIDLGVTMHCHATPGDPAPPTDCSAMALDCANFVELRLYQVKNGTTADILRSTCVAAADLGNPPDLCQLMTEPAELLGDVPRGGTVVFRLRALHAFDLAHSCNDDLADPKPSPLFDGYSAPVILDGESHSVAINLTTCYSCATLPKGPTPLCAVQDQRPSTSPASPSCCPPKSGTCLDAGDACSDGSTALMPPGGCCAVCPAY